MIIYKRLFVTAAESWYSVPNDPCPADILHCLQLESPLLGARRTDYQTIWIDLTKSEEDLLRDMHPNNRNRIRRSQQDALRYDFWNIVTAEQLQAFWKFFDTHAVYEGSRRELRRWTRAHAQHGTLDLSRTSDAQGRVLVWHAHYFDRRYARGKYSVSLSRDSNPEMRAVIGRANRYHTWEDMKRFKAKGVSVYDLGGWYSGKDDEKQLAVNKFKEEFGGQVVTAFHCTRALTAKGRVFLWAVDLRTLLRRAATECLHKLAVSS